MVSVCIYAEPRAKKLLRLKLLRKKSRRNRAIESSEARNPRTSVGRNQFMHGKKNKKNCLFSLPDDESTSNTVSSAIDFERPNDRLLVETLIDKTQLIDFVKVTLIIRKSHSSFSVLRLPPISAPVKLTAKVQLLFLPKFFD